MRFPIDGRLSPSNQATVNLHVDAVLAQITP
jgi:hypothetical protein